MKIKFKKNLTMSKKPTRGSEQAAGWDLYSAEAWPVTILPHRTKKFDTGIAVELPKGVFGGIYSRSGIATQRGLIVANGVGVIDSDYRGNLIVALHNDSDEVQIVEPGERIAQLIVMPYCLVEDFEEVNKLNNTERGDGGFGSTGTV